MTMGRYLNSLFSMSVLALTYSVASAHEGHQPLPTKGVQVDAEHGYLRISAQACSAIGLDVEEVQAGDVGSELVTYAETVAPWQAAAFGSAQIAGKITKLLVRPGDTVTKGQVVAELSSRELEIVRLSYLQAKNDLALNRKLLESTKPAAREGAVSQQRLDEIENALQQSENDLEIARIRASTLGLDARQFEDESRATVSHLIRSPISGRVIHLDLTEGKFVEAFEHLFDIVNLDEVWIKIQVLEKDIQKLSVGQKVELYLLDSKVAIDTKIDRVDVSLDPQTRVCWAWATVSRSSVMPGLVGIAKIRVSNESNRLSLPFDAVYSDGLQTYVFVEAASTKTSAEYKKRNVKLGHRISLEENSGRQRIEIIQGDVYPGDRVVVRGGHELSSLFFLEALKFSSDTRARLGIRTANAVQRPIADTLRLPASATLPPEARWTASSQLTGTIQSHSLTPGKRIRAGELLMEIASPDFQSLQLDLLQASLEANLVRHRAERLQRAGKDVFSRRVLLEMLNRADQLELKAESLKRQLVSLGLTASEVNDIVLQRSIQSLMPVRSPMDGYLVRWTGTLGETIIANQSLAEVQKIENIWIEALVPSQDSKSVSIADTGIVSVLSNPSIKFPAAVSKVGPIISPTTRTQRIWLDVTSFPAPFILRDGTQLSVALNVREPTNGLAVPSEAVLREGLHSFVFVQKLNGSFERRRVTVGRSDGQWIELLTGVSIGDEVIVAGGRELQTAYASLR